MTDRVPDVPVPDRGTEKVPGTVPVGTKNGTRNPRAGIENRVAGTGNREAGIENRGAGIESRDPGRGSR